MNDDLLREAAGLTTKAHPDGRRGRGALSNASGRYEKHERLRADDGWGALEEEPPPLRTTVSIDATREIIATNRSPDVGFDQSINPYRGCEHGCVYCFARPSHAWLGLSPGLDFESRLFAKPNAPALLEEALASPKYRPKVIAMGTNTDPYQPLEREMKITRGVLEVLERFSHPVAIVTKSHLVTRDADILGRMAARGLAKVCLSVTSLDPQLARRMEPRAATPPRRLAAIRTLSEAGVPAGVMFAPTIPALNDQEMEAVLEAAAGAGAKKASYVLLRLPLEIKDLWREWLAESYPDRAGRIMKLLREMRGGKDYDARWFERQRGQGAYAQLIAERFRRACARLGLNKTRFALNVAEFSPPPRKGEQLKLL
jgi:DNA repair photolyase